MYQVLERLHIQKLKIILNSNIFIVVLILIIFIRIIYSINNVNSKYNMDIKEISGIITDIKKDDNKTILYIKCKENMIVYYYNELNINIGDYVKVIGNIEGIKRNTNFNLFNYKKYLLSKKIYYKMIADNIIILSRNKNILYKLKVLIKSRIKNNIYLNTFIFGDNSYINDDVKESYRVNGISHLFSISGMHITLLSGIILFILNKISKKRINYIIVILFLILYLFLTNFSPSVIRAVCLFIFITLNKLLKLNLSAIKILIIIACIVLTINPYNIYNIGFKFSYIISFYLIMFNKILNKYKNYIFKVFITSFISFLVSIPILINGYFSINLLSIINNIIFVPLISIIIFPFSIIVFVMPKLNFIYQMLINILESISLFLTNYKIEIVLCHCNNLVILLYYLIITFILYKFSKGQYKYIVLIIIVIFIHTNINYISNNTYTTFIDVGQGDSTLIHLPYNKGDILIDTGGNIYYDLSIDIINYLKSKGIKSIDYLVLTHGDYDHIGSTVNLIKKFKIKNVVFNIGEFNNLELEIIKVLKKNNIEYYQNINILNIDKYKLYFLNTKEYDNENDNSSVIYTEINNTKMLFMGDAGINKEKDIIKTYNLTNIDILKVGHHGSDTSSSNKFIDTINPKTCLISVGKNNRYGHPKKSVIDTLKNCIIYRTDINGGIELKLNKSNYKIRTVN